MTLKLNFQGDIRMKKFILYLHFIIVFFIFQFQSFAQQPFVVETLQGGGAGTINSLALDVDGFAHISYFDDSDNTLKYAHWNGTSWSIQTVDNTPFAGTWNSLVLDSQSRPHIAYKEDTNDDLKYAFWNGNQWDIVAVQMTGDVGSYCSIALDDSDIPHISYIDEGAGKLLYANKTVSGWQTSTVDIGGIYGFGSALKYTSIALDKFNHPHISYSDYNTNSYKYAYHDGFQWNISILHQVSWVSGTRITLDAEDEPHIVYTRRDSRGGLFYLYKENDAWQFSDLDPSTNTVGYPSIKIDDKGYAHIAYGGQNLDLKYAYEDANGWHFQTVHSGFWDLHDRTIALDCMGKPYISFYDSGNQGVLKFARPPAYGPDPFSLVSPANGEYTTNTPTFRWELSSYQGNGLAEYELYIDGAFVKSIPATRCSTIVDLALSGGIHTWRIRAVLTGGGEIWSNETWSIQIDETSPQSFNLLNPLDSSWTSDRAPTFAWHASSDGGSGLKEYQLFINGILNRDNIDPSITSVESQFNLSDGDHVWNIIAEDNAGNTTQSNQSWTIRVDNTPPTVFSLISPANGSWTSDTTPTFSWQASSDNGSGLSGYELLIDGVVVDSINADSTSITLNPGSALSGGNHTWQIKAYDRVNNVRPSSLWNLRVDVTPPATFSLSSPSDSTSVNLPTPLFYWHPSQDLESGFSYYELWIDAVLSVDGISDTASAPGTPLSEGIHSWFVKAKDNVGNIRQSEEIWTVIWDPTPPAAFDLVSPSNEDTVTVGDPVLVWNRSGDSGSGLSRYEVWINGIKNRNVPPSDTASTPDGHLSNGQYNWFVKAVDYAGNETSSNSIWTFNVNHPNQGPQIIGLNDTTFFEDTSLMLTLNDFVIDDDSLSHLHWEISPLNVNDSLFINYDSISQTASFTASSNYFAYNLPIVFAVTDTFQASDSDTILISILPVNDPPANFALLLPADGDTVQSVDSVTFVWRQSKDVDKDTLQYSINISTAGFDTTVSNMTDTTLNFITNGVLLPQTTYFWRVHVTDGLLSVSSQDTFSFTTPAVTSLENV
jgi:predicted secreted protein